MAHSYLCSDRTHPPEDLGADDRISNTSTGPSFPNVLSERAGQPDAISTDPVKFAGDRSLFGGPSLTRRALMQGTSVIAALAVSPAYATATDQTGHDSSLTFPPLPNIHDEDSHVAKGYHLHTLIRWGDPVVAGAPAFDPGNQSAQAQALQFGYNNDFVAFMPLPKGSLNSGHGLLCVNHEYTIPHLMFPGITKENDHTLTQDQVNIEMAAHGHSVVEIKRTGHTWHVVRNSPLNRRLTALDTKFQLTGPAAGSERLKTSTDLTGTCVIGTINNCAGGKTPWGTILFAEENFDGYFAGRIENTGEARNYARLGVGNAEYLWSRYHSRFDVEKEPNEANRFGWIVEFDPYDPYSIPKKRTALGRFKHEGATTVLNKDGRVVVYSGDDQRFEYIYRFVTARPYDATAAGMTDLLDEGTLSVARFMADGTLEWLPLVFGQGALIPANDFHSQADVLIETRRAADLVGATPMDRPEDIETNPVTGVVYAAMTNNTKRTADTLDAPNPRNMNRHGHILELIPPGTAPDRNKAKADHTANHFTWDIFLLAGNPDKAEDQSRYGHDVGRSGWLSCPDNVAFDNQGRLWITTDGAPKAGITDGVWACDVKGDGRAITRRFYACPRGAELCGPEFTPDNSSYFASVQHPGDEPGSTYDTPSTRWPDFHEFMPPRPSIQVIRKIGGGPIG